MTISPDDITEETCLERLRDEGEPLQFFAFFGQRDELKAAGHAKLKKCLEALKAKGLITYSQSDHGYTLTEGDNGEPESGSVAELVEQPEAPAQEREPFSLAAPDPNDLAEQVAEIRNHYLAHRCDLEVLDGIARALEAVGEGVKMQPARDALHGARALHVRQHCDAEVLSKLDDAEMALAWLGRQLEAS